jgi:excisionase family DNA binding protein
MMVKKPVDESDETNWPIVRLTYTGDAASEDRIAQVLARILVRRALDELTRKHPVSPELKRKAAHTERPRISNKRLAKMEIMTAGEIARFLGVPAATIYHHVERDSIPHRRLGEEFIFSRAAVIEWLADGGEL